MADEEAEALPTDQAGEQPEAEATEGGQDEKPDNRADRVAAWRWKPGQSGNPGGRPKRKPLTDQLLDEVLKVSDDPRAKGMTIVQLLNRALISQALKGNVGAQRELRDRIEGKVPLTLKVGPEVEEESQTDLAITVIDVPSRVLPATAGNGSGHTNGGAGGGNGAGE